MFFFPIKLCSFHKNNNRTCCFKGPACRSNSVRCDYIIIISVVVIIINIKPLKYWIKIFNKNNHCFTKQQCLNKEQTILMHYCNKLLTLATSFFLPFIITILLYHLSASPLNIALLQLFRMKFSHNVKKKREQTLEPFLVKWSTMLPSSTLTV